MKHLIKATTLVGVVMMSGCATILNDDTQKINVSASNGQEIEGTVDGVKFKAPGIIDVKREDKDKIFIVDTKGCVNQTVAPKSVDSKFWINILSGGSFGSTTDYNTEEMWKYEDNVVISCK